MATRGMRLARCSFHTWLLPAKTVMGIFSLGVIMLFVGAVLMAIGGTGVSALLAIGAVFLGIGFFLMALCMFLCLYAYCVWYVSDAESQTVHTIPAHMSQEIDMVDALDWQPSYTGLDRKVPHSPNGVLRDTRQQAGQPMQSPYSKKHVTISPRSTQMYSPSQISGKQSESSRSSEYSSPRTDYQSIKTPTETKTTDQGDKHQLGSFSYLRDPQTPTPYSSLNPRRQNQQQTVHVPIQVQSGYGQGRQGESGKTVSVKPYYTEQGSISSSQLPPRRHSDDDYDNTSEMSSMIAYQSYPAQQRQQTTQWKQGNPPAQVHYAEPPPPQPLVYPSARRPMTFEQLSSSKVSVYDNIYMGFKEEID